jgi:hypothetical protein
MVDGRHHRRRVSTAVLSPVHARSTDRFWPRLDCTAVRGEYRLTYEPEPPTGLMFGFLNVAIGAALLWFGRSDDVVLEVLDERSADAFRFSDSGVAWRGELLTRPELDEVRTSFFVGFGSCSFREPMAEIGLEAVPHA